MRRTLIATTLAVLTAAVYASAAGVSVKGTYVEARTAEVFTGGCIMNGEAGTTGREALLAWKIDQGALNGVSLNGLAVVAAVAGDVNLGVQEIGGETASTRTALFVDKRASAPQQKALVALARQLSKGVVGEVVQVIPSPIEFADEGGAIRVVANSVRLLVQKELGHDPTCGGKQWFHPLATVDQAEMGLATENAFVGTALGTKWSDPNKRSGFFGTFSF